MDRIGFQLERYMDLVALRQKLVASNIANAGTPGYKTRDVDFASAYRGLLEGTPAAVVEVENLKGRNDGNNVSLEREARLLAENALRFSAASQLMRARLRVLRSAIKEGAG